MRLHLYGGFGEKGRTCLGVEVDGYRLLLDAGVKTSARGADYYPAISADELAATDAMVSTHAARRCDSSTCSSQLMPMNRIAAPRASSRARIWRSARRSRSARCD